MIRKSGVIFGGVGQNPQVEMLKARRRTCSSPRRAGSNDLIGQGFIDLDGLEIFVLDEADRMLDMGFIHDVRKCGRRSCPTRRQTLLFSAPPCRRKSKSSADSMLVSAPRCASKVDARRR
jgi:ATP-dependent RNA helicase RhlE